MAVSSFPILEVRSATRWKLFVLQPPEPLHEAHNAHHQSVSVPTLRSPQRHAKNFERPTQLNHVSFLRMRIFFTAVKLHWVVVARS